MQWYYADKHGKQEQAQQDQLAQLVAAGKIDTSTLVWNSSMPDWQQAGTVLPELFGSSSPSITPASSANEPRNFANQPSLSSPISEGAVAIHQPNPTVGLQVAALVCGILSVTSCMLLTGIPAIICGHLARSKQKALTQSTKGTGLALAGLIMGYIGTILPIILLIIGFVIESQNIGTF